MSETVPWLPMAMLALMAAVAAILGFISAVLHVRENRLIRQRITELKAEGVQLAVVEGDAQGDSRQEASKPGPAIFKAA